MFYGGVTDKQIDLTINKESLPVEDKWILSRLNRVTALVNQSIKDFQFGEGLKDLYDFLWNEYCDWYIELVKVRLRPEI